MSKTARTDRSPACRARSSQDTLAYLDRFRAGATLEVRRRLPDAVLEVIDSTMKTGWIPIEVDAAMGHAILELLGPQEARRFWTRFTTHHVESPLLAGPVRAALKLLGATPASLIKWMPRVFPTVFRDVFDIEIKQLDPQSAWLEFHVHSEVFWNEPVYALVLESTLHGFYEITRVAGSVRVSRDDPARIIHLRASWEPLGARPTEK
jgi:hypothetical protein